MMSSYEENELATKIFNCIVRSFKKNYPAKDISYEGWNKIRTDVSDETEIQISEDPKESIKYTIQGLIKDIKITKDSVVLDSKILQLIEMSKRLGRLEQ